jgi:hypothetical protein
VIEVKAESLMNETVNKVRYGSIVYTVTLRGYDSLMFCRYRHLNIDHRYKINKGNVASTVLKDSGPLLKNG